MRITSKQIQARVARLNKMLGRPETPYTRLKDGGMVANEGHIMVDHNSIYGGYILREMAKGGGESNFLSSSRCNAATMALIIESFIEGYKLGKG